MSEHHYCDFLKKWNSYAVPLTFNGKTLGCIALFVNDKSIKKEFMAVTELLGYKILNEFTKLLGKNINTDTKINFRLKDKEITILKFLSRGFTDLHIASEMNLSVSTIRYHKSKIFKKLDVVCSLEAIIKALKLDILTMSHLDF